MSEKLEVAQSWFHRVWAAEDEAAIDDLFVPDVPDAAKGLGSAPLAGPNEFKEFHRLVLSLLKNVNVTVDKFTEDGDWISILATLGANCRKSDAPVEMKGQMWIRITDGKLREAHNQFDFIGMFESLQLMPPGSMEQCLSGRCLVSN